MVWAAPNDLTAAGVGLVAALPVLEPDLEAGWLAVVNGLPTLSGDDVVAARRLSAGCLEATAWCLAADGTWIGAEASGLEDYNVGTGTSYAAPLPSSARPSPTSPPAAPRPPPGLEGAYAPNTLRAYRSDWAHYLDFCENAGLTPLPASPDAMEAFIAFGAQHAVATVERRLYSVRKAHELAGLKNPCADIGVALALRWVRRAKPNRPGQALGVRRDMLERMIASQPGTLQGIRNRALLSIGFDFLTRRSELASLRTKDLELQADGTECGLIRRSKADQMGFGRTVFGSTRSGALLSEWLEAREVETPWLFCPVRHGFAYDRPLSTSQVKNIIKAAAKSADIEGEVSGHSLRVGAAQELMARGADIGTIMRAGGWKTVDVVARYVQKTEVNVWANI